MGKWVLAIIVGLCTSSFAAAAVRIDEASANAIALDDAAPRFRVTADTYSAEVYPDGRLRLLRGQTELLKNLSLTYGGKPETLAGNMSRTGDTVHIRIGAPQKRGGDILENLLNDDNELGGGDKADLKTKLPDAGGVDVKFLADNVEMTIVKLAKGRVPAGSEAIPPEYVLSGSFGDEAVGVTNLRNKVQDALPTRRMPSQHIFSFMGYLGNYWPNVDVDYADGTRMRIDGIFGVAYSQLGKGDNPRGYWSLQNASQGNKVVLTIAAPQTGKVLAAPYITIKPDKPRALFYENEPIVYHLQMHPDYVLDGTWRAAWSLDDHRGAPVASGQQDIIIANGKLNPSSITIDPKQMGYFYGKLELFRPDTASAHRTFSLEIARIRPEHPELRDLDAKGGGEVLWANILGMRGIREVQSWETICKTARDADGNYDWTKALADSRASMDLCRKGTVTTWCSFLGAEGWPKALNIAPKPIEMPKSETRLDTRGGNADDLEITLDEPAEKEPKTRVPPSKQVANLPQPPAAEVRQKETAKYLTEMSREGAKIGINTWEPINEPDLAMSQQGYLDSYLKPQYPAVKAGNPNANFLGGSLCGLDKYTWLRKLYELGGQQYFDDVSMHPYTGVGFQEVYRRQLQNYFDLFAEYGKPQTKLWLTEAAYHRGWGYNDYVYDRFNAYRESHARDAVNMVLNAEAMGVPRERIAVFYFTEHGYNDFFLVRYGSLTSAAVSLQVMNENLRDAVFQGESPLPTPGHYLQTFRDDQRTVAIGFSADEPAELKLLTDAPQVQVTDMMGNRTTVTPKDGRFSVSISGDPTYMQVSKNQTIKPDYSQLPIEPNLALVTLGASASASGTDPQYPPNGAICGDSTMYSTGLRYGWKEEESAANQFPDWYEVRLPKAVPVSRVRVFHDFGAWERVLRSYEVQAFVDGEWKTVDQVKDNRWRNTYDHRFEPVLTDRVRVSITGVNSCLFEDMDWIKKASNLRCVEVYGPPTGPAKAFILPELPQPRPMKGGQTLPLTFKVHNTQDQPINADVRLTLPDGLTADAQGKPLSLAPGAEGDCAFNVTMRADVPPGLYTVLAGVYQGDALVSPDHAARVLTVKAEKVAPAPKPAPQPAPAAENAQPRDALDVMNQAQDKK